MNVVIPKPVWQGMDVYIIGGGNSLKSFDWNLLENLKTIGCNDAYQLGANICKVCLFGDTKWWLAHAEKLKSYRGVVYGIAPLNVEYPDYVQCIKRYASGLETKGLGWNGNTGFAAVNLAILMGAARIYLLGFDMKQVGGEGNWHPNNLDNNNQEIYNKFLGWEKFLHKAWKKDYAHIEIYNVTDDSDLKLFPKISANKFWQKRLIA